MDTQTVPSEHKKRSWRNYLFALGRAHRKASVELETSMPLLQHLEELRQRIFKAFGALILTTTLSFLFAGQLIDFFAGPLGGKQALVSIEVTENMAIFMRVALLSGVTLGMPFVVYQLMRFLLPGLKGNERYWLLLGVPMASLFFVAGAAFTWFVMIPTALHFLVTFQGITTQVRPTSYFQFVTTLIFWIGVSFEMPMVVLILAKFKIVKARQLLAGWRYATVAIAVVAAVITPTVDPVSMSLVMLPLAGLYIISILFAAFAGRS